MFWVLLYTALLIVLLAAMPYVKSSMAFRVIAEVAGRQALSTPPWQLIADIHCSDDRCRSRMCDDEERDGGNALVADVVSGSECVRWLWGGAVTPVDGQV